MMSFIWCAAVIGSLAYAAFSGSAAETAGAGINAAKESVNSLISFAGIMCMWSGIMKIADKSGMAEIISRALSPLTRILFPKLKKGSAALKAITMNMTANLLGMGNAATPAGLEAMKELDKINPSPERASEEMSVFTVLNTASFQLVPTTIIALRSAAESENPAEITAAVWIVSAAALAAAVISVKLMYGIFGRKRQ